MRRLATEMHGKETFGGKRVLDGQEMLEDVCCARNARKVALREKVCSDAHREVFSRSLGGFYDTFCSSEVDLTQELAMKLSDLSSKSTSTVGANEKEDEEEDGDAEEDEEESSLSSPSTSSSSSRRLTRR